MERETTDYLHAALRRDINGLLELDGLVLPDREIAIAPEDVEELDVVDIVIGRNEALGRTVCHLHRPTTEEVYWRHDTFVAWDDGRTANFQINIALSDTERSILQTLPASAKSLTAELGRLVHHGVLQVSEAQAMEQMILAEMTHVKDEVDDALMKQDELAEEDTVRVIKAILETVNPHMTLNREPHSDFSQLYTIIRRLRRAQFEAMLLRDQILDRYLKLSDQRMDAAEADPRSMAEPVAVWNLLELLDKIR